MSLVFGCFVTYVTYVMCHFWSCKVGMKYCNLTLNSRKETIRQSTMWLYSKPNNHIKKYHRAHSC